MKGFEQGRFDKVKLQPFGERLQSPWATSVCEAIAHDSVRKNPFKRAKTKIRSHKRADFVINNTFYLILRASM